MASSSQTAIEVGEVLRPGRVLPRYLRGSRRLAREKPLATVGFVIVVVLLFTAVFANLIAPEGFNELHPERISLSESLGRTGTEIPGPSLAHPMGVDALGRDMLSRVIYGARISMIVAFGAVILGTSAAAVIGMTSAYFGGKFDTLLQRLVDAWLIFPWLILLISVSTILGNEPPIGDLSPANWGIIKVILALAIGDIPWASRVIRSAAMSVKENPYVEAARAIGASALRINLRYVLPNIMGPIIVMFTLGLGFAILSEAALSFLGFGVPPPNPSWGADLSLQGTYFFYRAPWIAVFPGVMITVALFGINVLGDGLRDLLDPRLRGAHGGLGR